ncbi:MAG: hypothetical protein HY560_12605 [Gemmatimonadetes bacterium]|nr:hypothetical protein [Gemmatimonadota bacterium]
MRTTLVGRLVTCTVLLLAVTGPVHGQAAPFRLRVDPKASLAWWQVNPHLSHLWATTCPQEPSWRPGEGTSLAWASEFLKMRSKTGHANIRDTVIPMYPRKRARSLCTEAVTGEISAADTLSWRGVRGLITVRGEHLITGLTMRDEYAKKAILKTAVYPELRFAIDSLSPLQASGDTLRGTVFGTFQVLGTEQRTNARLRVWPEAGGLRVQAQWMVPAHDLVEVFGISKLALGIGAAGTIWEELHMGIDLVLVPTQGS